MYISRILLAACVAFLCHTQLSADVVHDELVDGELSGDNISPTDVGLLILGPNSVEGTVTSIGTDGSNGTADIFTFTIGSGQVLESRFMTDFSTASGGALFFVLDDGPTFEFTPEEINDAFTFPDLTQILGARAVGTAEEGGDFLNLLQDPAERAGGSAFTIPLGAGQYSVYIQETGPSSTYDISFNVATAVPEPSSKAMLGFLSLACLIRRSRK